MGKYYVNYKLYGTVLVEADSEREAEEFVNEKISDSELLDGVHISDGIDGDSIDIYAVEEVEE